MRALVCPVCGEDWELDTLHEEVAERRHKGLQATFTVVVRQFQHEGCGVALAASCGPLTCHQDPSTAELAATAAMIYELLGDDIDGAINEIEDYRLLTGQ